MFQASSMLKSSASSSDGPSIRQQWLAAEAGVDSLQYQHPDDDDTLSDAVIAMFVDKVNQTIAEIITLRQLLTLIRT